MEIYEAMRSKKGKQNLEEDSEEENEGLPEPMDEDNGAGKMTDDQRCLSAKGQLISKGNCQVVNSSKKRTNEFNFITMIPLVFVRFWKKLKTPKRHFEIN